MISSWVGAQSSPKCCEMMTPGRVINQTMLVLQAMNSQKPNQMIRRGEKVMITKAIMIMENTTPRSRTTKLYIHAG